jgi:hypothetical protein
MAKARVLFTSLCIVFFPLSNSKVPMPYLGSTHKMSFEPNLMLKTPTSLSELL